jgi:hypothetical protein
MPNLRRGYLPAPVILFLAGLSLFVAAIIVFNTQLVKNLGKPTQTAPSNSPSTVTPMPTPMDETANWKTYTNQKNGFSIQYPKEYIFNENSLISLRPLLIEIISKSPKEREVNMGSQLASYTPLNHSNVSIYNEERLLDENFFSQLIKEGYLREHIQTKNFIEEKFTKKDSSRTYGNEEMVKIFIRPTNSTKFTITLQGNVQYESSAPEILSTFNQILSTFKFTDRGTDTSNWKTYLDPKLGFSIQYPTRGNFYLLPNCPDNPPFGFVIVSSYRCGSDTTAEMSISSKSKAEKDGLFNPEGDKCFTKTTKPIKLDGRDETKLIYKFKDSCLGKVEIVYHVKETYIYPKGTDIVIFYSTDTFDESKFDQILSTFQFTN